MSRIFASDFMVVIFCSHAKKFWISNKILCPIPSRLSSFSNILWVKPLKISKKAIDSLKKSKFGIVIDPSYEFCGVSQSISYELTKLTGKPVYAMGLRERSPGVAKRFENGTPGKNQIIKFVKEKLNL